MAKVIELKMFTYTLERKILNEQHKIKGLKIGIQNDYFVLNNIKHL